MAAKATAAPVTSAAAAPMASPTATTATTATMGRNRGHRRKSRYQDTAEQPSRDRSIIDSHFCSLPGQPLETDQSPSPGCSWASAKFPLIVYPTIRGLARPPAASQRGTASAPCSHAVRTPLQRFG